MIHGILLDLAGVLYQGNQRLPGASEALARLRENGLPVRFITNTTRKTKALVLAQLHDLGLAVEGDELFTAAEATKRVLRDRKLTPYLLIHPDLEPDFADIPPGQPNAVVVADAGPAFTYDNLNRAFRLVQDGAPLLAVAKNRYFSEDGGLSLDAGPFVAALEYAGRVEAEIIGKPAAAFFAGAVASMESEPGATVMVGDDVESDVNGALEAGLQALLVRTGKYRSGDEDAVRRGGETVADIAAAVDWVLHRRDRG